MRYYSTEKIDRENAIYNVIYGERSNGKTYSVLQKIVKNFAKGNGTGAYIRRWNEDFAHGTATSLFNGLVQNNEIAKATKGRWTGVRYWSNAWYFTREDAEGKVETMKDPFCYKFALTGMEHTKSSSYPSVTTICFDEFISRKGYLPDEFVLFMNVLSTIIRDRDNVTIYMLGNSVNKFCPYFKDMGLNHVKFQKKDTIDMYRYGDTKLTVAVEYSDKPEKSKPSDKYFAFDNPELKMITSGEWEISVYPHLPLGYHLRPKDIKFIYFIQFEENTLQCEVVMNKNENFTYIHKKTTPLKKPEKDLIYNDECSILFNRSRNISRAATVIQNKILWYYSNEKVFYQDNDTGEIVRNYIMWCRKNVLA